MIYILLITLFILRTVNVAFYEFFLIQLKEYRSDRIFSFLKSPQGVKFLFNPKNYFKWAFLPLIILFPNNFLIIYAIGLIYAAENILALKNFRSIKRPKVTLRIVLSVLTLIIIFYSLFLIPDLNTVLKIIMIDRFLFPAILLSAGIANIPFFIIKKILFYIAKLKLSSMKDLKRIGITGSYGKTTSKHFISTVLSEKFNTVSTSGYNNTETAAELTILKKIRNTHEVFVCEMGAYKKGEISAIADLIKPDIGVITGLGDQHLELFGNQEGIFAAKYELIESIKENGTAIFNICNCQVFEMAKKTIRDRPDLKIILCSAYDEKTLNGTDILKAVKIRAGIDFLNFTAVWRKESIKIETGIPGIHNTGNILLAAAVAITLGFTGKEIEKAAEKLFLPEKTMRLKKIHGTNIIFDTFNNNSAGIIAGVEYMRLFKDKKILVFTPLIELGEKSCGVHKNLGEIFGKYCDRIYLTNSNYHDCLVNGAGLQNSKKFITVNVRDFNILKEESLTAESILYLSGKEAGAILKK